MHYDGYRDDKDLVIKLHDMAREYDIAFLRKVADKLDDLIEDKDKEYDDGK